MREAAFWIESKRTTRSVMSSWGLGKGAGPVFTTRRTSSSRFVTMHSTRSFLFRHGDRGRGLHRQNEVCPATFVHRYPRSFSRHGAKTEKLHSATLESKARTATGATEFQFANVCRTGRNVFPSEEAPHQCVDQSVDSFAPLSTASRLRGLRREIDNGAVHAAVPSP